MSTQTGLDFSAVLASSVHDMKNSLSLLLTSIDEIGLELSAADSPMADRMAILQYEAARVNNDLVQLLSLYKLDQNVLSPVIDEHHVRDLLEEEVSRYHPLFQSRNVACHIDCADDLFGFFDRDLISGVIGNVLANTIRYTRGAIRVAAETTGQGGIVIRVEDDGQGFPQRMLDQDNALNRSTNFQTGSTNLGLYFAKRVAQLHIQNDQVGSVALSNGSSLGGGVFHLTLP